MQVLDSSIANVSIPNISGDLGVSPNQGTWVITSFAVSNAIVLPLTGWLADYFGRVRLFIYSVLLFSLTSLLCGLAPTLPLLIFFRVLQGASAGSLIPLSQSLLLLNYPKEKQGLALGIWAMVVVVAPILGPIVGGWLTDDYGWPWIFYINVPIGILSALITWTMLRERDSEQVRVPIDYFGLVLLTIGVGCLQIFFDKGNDLDWFSSNVIVTLLVVATLSLLFFLIWNHFARYPIVNTSFFRDRNFFFGTAAASIGYMIFFASSVLLPLWLQTQMGYTAFLSGVAIAPIGIIPILLAAVVGSYMHRFDLRLVASVSFLIFSYTFFWFSDFTTAVGLPELTLPRLVQGLGVSLFFVPLVQIALADIPPQLLASASGVFNFIRIMVGSGFGTAIFVTLWDRRTTLHHSQLGESINAYRPVVTQAQAQVHQLGLSSDSTNQFLDLVVEQQAAMLGLNDVFWLCGWIFLAMIPFLWLCRSNRAPVLVGHE